jgi:YHS domain-containing protein
MGRRVFAVALVLILLATSTTAWAQAKKAEKARDPVDGILVDKDPKLSVTYKGEVYYFCSKADMDKFKKEPEKYLKK